MKEKIENKAVCYRDSDYKYLDSLLTAVLVFIFWLCAQVFGNNLKSIVISGTTTSYFYNRYFLDSDS